MDTKKTRVNNVIGENIVILLSSNICRYKVLLFRINHSSEVFPGIHVVIVVCLIYQFHINPLPGHREKNEVIGIHDRNT